MFQLFFGKGGNEGRKFFEGVLVPGLFGRCKR